MEAILGFLIAAVVVVFYFIPTFVAFFRRHNNLLAIGALNLIFGSTGIGWGVALVWALTDNRREI
jgi:hypothetical protein